MRKFIAYTEHFFTSLFSYGRPERPGIVLIVAIAAAVLLFVTLRPGRAPDAAHLAEADRLGDSLRTAYLREQAALRPHRDSSRNTFTFASRTRPGPKPAVYIELNTADSARLTTVRGIGPAIARAIVRHRARLGGFAQNSQLREVWGITDENFEPIAAQFFIDTAVIQKINLNFVAPNILRAHPCFSGSMVERITRGRERFAESTGETKGGWTTLKELTDNDILLPDEAEKIAPYVAF
jgi:DNA uptake protein ComE-like DNA-binding protein